MGVTPLCALFHQFRFNLQEFIVTNGRGQGACVACCGDLYGFRDLGYKTVQVEDGQERDIAQTTHKRVPWLVTTCQSATLMHHICILW